MKVSIRLFKKFSEQLYANKLDNLEEMDKFLETYSPPKLNQDKTDNLKRPITTNEIEAGTKNSPKPKVLDWMAS